MAHAPKTSLQPTPPAKQAALEIALLPQKREIIHSLLLRAGISEKDISQDNRAQAVLDNYRLYLIPSQRVAGSEIYRSYDLGRQFLVRGGVSAAIQAAEIAIPLLQAQTMVELEARTRNAEKSIAAQILPLNHPSS